MWNGSAGVMAAWKTRWTLCDNEGLLFWLRGIKEKMTIRLCRHRPDMLMKAVFSPTDNEVSELYFYVYYFLDTLIRP